MFMISSLKQKIQNLLSFYGWKRLIKIGINAFLPNRACLKVAFNKINYTDYFYFKKHFSSKVCAEFGNNCDFKGLCTVKNIVWTMWLQGEDNAPDIVKACWDSLRCHLPSNFKIVVLDQNILKEYIKLPDFIEKKYAAGIITKAHYSDLVRLKLLLTYGGYWVDSTVYCTNRNLFNFIDKIKPPLFVYRNMLRCDDACALSNWFLYAEPNNVILRNVYEILVEYWKKHDKPKNYFLFHIIFKIVVEKLPREWAQTPIMNNVCPHVLAYQLFDSYNEAYFEFLKQMSSFHKLTYRNKEANLLKKDTYYQHIIASNRKERCIED